LRREKGISSLKAQVETSPQSPYSCEIPGQLTKSVVCVTARACILLVECFCIRSIQKTPVSEAIVSIKVLDKKQLCPQRSDCESTVQDAYLHKKNAEITADFAEIGAIVTLSCY
jgi:hypothetical protein